MNIGEIRLFAGDYEPEGWRFCNGQTLPPADHQELFGKIGTKYGGDGKQSFALPDFRGRAPMHISNDLALASTRTIDVDARRDNTAGRVALNFLIAVGPEGWYRDSEPMVGEVRAFALNFTPRGWLPSNGVLLSISQNTMLFALLSSRFGGDGVRTFAVPDLSGAYPFAPQNPSDSGQKGGARAETEGNVTKPLLALRYCIALNGIFPSRR
jgi:microcystin-dependent protein